MLTEAKEELAKALSVAVQVGEQEALASIEYPKNEFGDLASTIAFSLAKAQKRNPVQIANEIEAKIKLPPAFEKAVATGPYLNFFFSKEFFAKIASAAASAKKKLAKKKKEKVLIEFPSVNPNKPWHMGHLRNALLGDSVSRLLEHAGFVVEREDYIDDLGLQVAQSFWGYKNFPEKPPSNEKFDHWLGKQYVKVSAEAEKPEINEQVRKILHEMEKGGSKTSKDARALVEKCVLAQYQTSFAYGIFHDVLIFESDIAHVIFKEGMERIKKSDRIVQETQGKNAGCLVAKMSGAEFEGMENPDKILIRSDGTATYTGKDVIFHLWKAGLLKGDFAYSEFVSQPNGKMAYKSANGGKKMKFGNADILVNVIGMEQSYPQKVVAQVVHMVAEEGKKKPQLVHLAYEHAALPDVKFSGREGTWIGYTADELLAEGIKRAAEKIKPEITGTEREKIASAIASGAIRFSFLKTCADKKIIFEWDRALSMEGDSAPYVIYAHARCGGILEKAAGRTFGKANGYAYSKEEMALLKKILQFDETTSRAAEEYRPHMLCDYLLDLASAFNKFYTTSPILAEGIDENTASARLEIVKATKKKLADGLELLGIKALEKM
jgi:arginyl-tRNA synthetase